MNFKELTKKQRQLVLEVMWQVSRVAYAQNFNTTLKEAKSFDYDPTACQEQFRDLLRDIEKYNANSEKYSQLKELLK